MSIPARSFSVFVVLLLWASALAAAAWPVLSVARSAAGDWAGALRIEPRLLLWTFGWAAGTALLAAAFSLPAAWAVRTRGWGAALWLLAAMLFPPYLAYSGWGMLRDPGTWLGTLIEGWARDGRRWLPLAVGRALAVVGLALWAAPLAAVVIGTGLRRIDDAVFDALALEPMSRRRRYAAGLRLAAGPIGAAFGLVFVLMLGSAVPFHLAQVETYAMRSWLMLDQSPWDERWRAMASAWPLLAAGVVAAMVLGGRLGAAQAGVGAQARGRGGLGAGGAVLLLLAVGVPMLIFAFNIQKLASFATFWRVSGDAFAESLGLAGVLAAVGVVLCAATNAAYAQGGAPRASAMWCLRFMLAAALAPGVLVGAATAGAWSGVPAVGESGAAVVLALTARYGGVAMLIGVLLARSEPRELAEMRALDGARTARGWARACLARQWPGVLAAGAATGALALHEIEAAVIVQPAGRPSFSRVMLGHLHFARTEDLCVGAAMVLGAGVIAAATAGLAGAALLRRARAQ